MPSGGAIQSGVYGNLRRELRTTCAARLAAQTGLIFS